MKEWLTTQELAAAELPELPRTKMGVKLYADREGWNDHPSFARKRAGRGGGTEYHFRLLPTPARIEWQRRHLKVGIVDLPPAANDQPTPAIEIAGTRRASLSRDARLAVLKAFERYAANLPGLPRYALQSFVGAYNARRIAAEEWVLGELPRITKDQVKRWSTKKRAGKALGFDRGLSRKGTGVLALANGGAAADFITVLLAEKPHMSGEEMQRQLRFQFGDTLEVVSKGLSKTVPVPPVRTIQHFVKSLKVEKRVPLLAITNPDAFRSHHALSGTNSLGHVTEANQLWQIDASPIDALCTDGRHSVYSCLDIATRRTRWYVSKTAKSEAVGLLIRKAILAWGVPDEVKIDNGSDFVATATRRLFASLDITMTVSDAYSPQQKGHVERVIKTMQHMLIELVPGYVGHSVADRKAIESRKSFAKRLGQDDATLFEVKLSSAELQDVIDRWADTLYAHRPHKGLKGQTPFQVAATSAAPIRVVDERALDVLLAPIVDRGGLRTVTKFGVQIEHKHYIADGVLPGKQVMVRRDPADMGRVLLFDPTDETFLDEAICAELAGITYPTWMKARREARSDLLREATKIIRTGMRDLAKGPALYERSLAIAARDLPNVVVLPPKRIELVTPAIAGAQDAATRDDARPSIPTGRHAEIHEQLKAEWTAPATSNVVAIETPRTRFRRAQALELQIAAGEPVPFEDAIWLNGYQQTTEYRSEKFVHDEFAARG